MILNYPKLLSVSFVAFIIVSMTSCNKNDLGNKIALISSDYKNIHLKTGFVDNGITIHAKDWSITYLKDAVSGEKLLDKDGKPVVLNTIGSVELQDGWLKLVKKEENNLLNITLKENFSGSPRKFLVGIFANGSADELSFTQMKGAGYEVVKKEIIEVPGSRKEYTSNEGCYTITLSNNTSAAKYMETSAIYKDVNYVSEFSSNDEAAFKWITTRDSLIFMSDLLKDGMIYWSKQVPYKEGRFLESYIKVGNRAELLIQPYSNIKVSGEVEYLERECHYTFTIKNQSSGHLFDISGTWKQKVPLSTTTHMF